MRIHEIRKLEKGKTTKEDIEEIAKKLALFSGFVGILALIFNLSSSMKDVEGTLEFLSIPISKILYYSSIIVIAASLSVVGFIITSYIIVFLWRLIPALRSQYLIIKETKSLINYNELEKKAKELIKKFPWYVWKSDRFFFENVFTYTGVSIIIGAFIFDQDELLLCKTQDFHGKFQIVGSNLEEEILKDYPDVSRFNFYWDFYLKRFLNEGWEKITLKSTWTDGEFIIKQCLRKDDYLIIYDIEKKETLEI